MTITPKAKVYEEVLREVKGFIEKEELSPGDKLPSERELADQLCTARSSVREALRAMELLGLIETRRGEGTYLRAYRPHHMVELLSTFILQESKTKGNLRGTKIILEKEAARLAIGKLTDEDMKQLSFMVQSDTEPTKEFHFSFFFILFEATRNELLLKIWQLMEEFSRTVDDTIYHHQVYENILRAIEKNDIAMINDVCDLLYKEKMSK